MLDVPTNYVILQEPSGEWALWATEARDLVIRSAHPEAIVTFFDEVFGPESVEQVRTEISYTMSLTDEERAERWRATVDGPAADEA